MTGYVSVILYSKIQPPVLYHGDSIRAYSISMFCIDCNTELIFLLYLMPVSQTHFQAVM